MSAKKKMAAQKEVPSWIVPAECFIWYTGNAKGWEVIPGTPCAHYVAHQLDLRKSAGAICDKGHHLRVRELLAELEEVSLDDLQINDVWLRLKGDPKGDANAKSKEPTDHCGMVTKITRDNAKKVTAVEITHNSSGQKALATNDWKLHFGGGGKFYRKKSTVQSPSAQANAFRLSRGLPYREHRIT